MRRKVIIVVLLLGLLLFTLPTIGCDSYSEAIRRNQREPISNPDAAPSPTPTPTQQESDEI